MASLDRDKKRTQKSSGRNSFLQSAVSRSKYGPRAAAGCVGPQALSAERGAKRNFTTKYGRERAVMFNQLSLGKKKEKEL